VFEGWFRDRTARAGRSIPTILPGFGPVLSGMLAIFAPACSSEACSNGDSARSAPAQLDASTPMPATSTPTPARVQAPPTGPAALGQARAFHFVVPLAGKPNAVVPLDGESGEASSGWVTSGSPADGSWHVAAGILIIDEGKLPEALRLRGLVVHVYADDKLLCEGMFGAARVGAVGESSPDVGGSHATRETSYRLGPSMDRVLFFEIDVPPGCYRKSSGARVAWARDVSLPAPVIVGRSEPAMSATSQKDVRDALRLVRATPAFVRTQREADHARSIYRLRAMALERMHEYGVTASWTRFRWNGENRGYLAIVADCRPPAIDLGFDFRETASGSLEIIHGRSNGEDVTVKAVDPVVIVDVDADGRLEVIEATEIFYRLRSFDGTEHYVLHTMDHCR